MDFALAVVMIFLCCGGGIIWAIFNWLRVLSVRVDLKEGLEQGLKSEEHKLEVLLEIGVKISDVNLSLTLLGSTSLS